MFLGLGASGVNIDPTVWLMLYGNASALQIGLYVWNRRHNVSPHEPEGSGGVAGMVMSALSAPSTPARCWTQCCAAKPVRGDPKGDSTSPDTFFGTFRIHLFFILVFGGSIVAGFVLGHAHPAMLVCWPRSRLLITASPVFVWRWTLRQERRKRVIGEEPQDSVVTPGQPAGAHAPSPRPRGAATRALTRPCRSLSGDTRNE